MAGRRVVQQFVRLFQWVPGRGGAAYQREGTFSYPHRGGAAQPAAEEGLGVEKYTARHDLTADGVDFESLYGFDE